MASSGYIDSQQNITLSCKVEGQTTIISIVPEGTQVAKGELICELDSSSLIDRQKTQEISVNDARSAVEQQLKSIEIQLATNESNIAAGELAVQLAELDLNSYELGTFLQTESQLSGQVALREEELIRALENFEFTRRLVNKGLRTQNDLAASRLAVQQAEQNRNSAFGELEVLQEFTYERQMAELRANAEEFVRELQRVELQCEAIIAQMQTELSSLQTKLDLQEEELERINQQIEACTMVAPEAGVVVYANLGGRGGRREGEEIRERATVYERQAIVNLPDVTRLKVGCRIHEALVGDIRVGLPVQISLNAIANRVFNGTVHSIASVASTGDWPNTDLRLYATEIHLTDPPDVIVDLKPGLTANVKIIVESRQNVLQIPVQCVVAVGNERLAWVMTDDGPERRLLEVGSANTSHIEILDGVAEGELVVQNPRTHFAREISDREGELAAEAEENTAEATDGVIPVPEVSGTETETPADSGSGGGGPSGGNRLAEMFTQADADGDGKLSESEVDERMKPNFATIDANGDGGIDQEEMGNFFRSQGGGRPGGGGPPAGDSATEEE